MLPLFNKQSSRSLPYGGLVITLFVMTYAQIVAHPEIAVHAASSDSNLAGYTSYGKQGTYREANVLFTIPSLAHIAGTGLSIWVGVGTEKSIDQNGHQTSSVPTTLVHTGINSSWNATQGQVNEAFWEIIGDNVPSKLLGQHSMNLQTNPGDLIWVYVSSNANNSGKDVFTIQDLATHKTSTYSLANPNTLSDGTTAECIVETPTVGNPVSLAKFGTVTLKSCGVHTHAVLQDSWIPIGNMPHEKTDLVRNSTMLAAASNLSNESDFTVATQNIGPSLSPPTPRPSPPSSKNTGTACKTILNSNGNGLNFIKAVIAACCPSSQGNGQNNGQGNAGQNNGQGDGQGNTGQNIGNCNGNSNSGNNNGNCDGNNNSGSGNGNGFGNGNSGSGNGNNQGNNGQIHCNINGSNNA